MPIIKSAKKRVKVTAKASARNARTKRNLRDSLKAFTKALEAGKPAEISKAQNSAVSAIDTAAKKSVIHKNKAARQKAKLAARVKAAGIKSKASPSVKKTSAGKPAAKTPAKKTPKETKA